MNASILPENSPDVHVVWRPVFEGDFYYPLGVVINRRAEAVGVRVFDKLFTQYSQCELFCDGLNRPADIDDESRFGV